MLARLGKHVIAPPWRPMADAPQDRHVLLKYRHARLIVVEEGWWNAYASCWRTLFNPMARALSWMEIP